MKRNDMVIEVINLYDKIDELKLRIKELELGSGRVPEPMPPSGSAEESPIQQEIYNLGRKALYGKVVEDNSWKMRVKVERKGDAIIATDYSEWVTGDVIDHQKIPADVSYQQFYDFFKEELKADYEKRKACAIKQREERELKDKLEEKE